jgi:hypothetical protein
MPRARAVAKEHFEQFPGDYEIVPIDSIKLDPDNARTHNRRNLDSIRGSLKEFGQRKPIVVQRATRVCIAGNGTLLAAQEEKWTKIAVVWTDLSKVKAKAYGISDNRSGELAAWDHQTLAQTLKALKDAGVNLLPLGWTNFELEPLFEADWRPPAVSELPEGKERINFTLKQWDIIQRAIRLSNAVAQPKEAMRESDAVTWICQRFLKDYRKGGASDVRDLRSSRAANQS